MAWEEVCRKLVQYEKGMIVFLSTGVEFVEGTLYSDVILDNKIKEGNPSSYLLSDHLVTVNR